MRASTGGSLCIGSANAKRPGIKPDPRGSWGPGPAGREKRGGLGPHDSRFGSARYSQARRMTRRRSAALLALGMVAVSTVLLVASTARADWLADIAAPFERALTSGSWGLALGFMF